MLKVLNRDKTSLGQPKQKFPEGRKSNGKEADDGLPTSKTDSKPNPLSLRYLFIAPPKFGKTEFFMQFAANGALLLACEEGHKLVEGFKIVIDCFDYKSGVVAPWQDDDGNMHMSFRQALNRIKESDRFPFVIIDTVDALVRMITDFYELTNKVQHISELGDYGKGFDMGQNSPFRKAINEIVKTGRGIGFTTHQQINQATFKNGPKAKKESSLPNGITKLLIPQVDAIMHGEFGSKRKPNRFRDRILITEGNEEMIAGNRGGVLPTHWIVPFSLKDRWKQFEKFFTDPKSVAVAEAEYFKIYE